MISEHRIRNQIRNIILSKKHLMEQKKMISEAIIETGNRHNTMMRMLELLK